jgi:hypothetical protein
LTFKQLRSLKDKDIELLLDGDNSFSVIGQMREHFAELEEVKHKLSLVPVTPGK